MQHDIIIFVVGLSVGVGGGIWAWSKYKAKAAADLVSLSKKVS